MKKYYMLLTGTMFLAVLETRAQTKIGAAGAPDGSAMLEVTSGPSSNKGLLLPRMTTAQRNVITSPAKGLMIYNTTTNQAEINNGTPALPVWAATTTTSTAWTTDGNTGTTPAANFIGTSDNQALTIRTNNLEKMRVTTLGRIGIGTIAPLEKLHVTDTGDVAIVIASGATNKSQLQLNNDNHGIIRNLTNSGGNTNDVALYTSSGSLANQIGDLYLISNPVASNSNSLPLNQFVLKNTGNVGIGTNAPAQKLDVVGTARISGSTGTPTTIAGRNALGDIGNVTIGTGLSLTGGALSVTGGVNNWGITGNTGTTPTTNFIGTTDNQPLTLRTNNTEKVRLTAAGDVGIGTNAPAAKLHVDTGGLMITNGTTALANPAIQVVNNGGGPGNNDNIVINSFGTNTQPSIGTQSARGTFSAPQNSQAGDNIGNFFFNSRVNGSVANSNVIRGVYLGNGTTNKSRLNFFTSNTQAMTIDSNGYVGIGTGLTAPTEKLHLVDTGKVSIRIASSTNNQATIQLGNANHGIIRNLTSSGGNVNDVAFYTSTGSVSAPADLYLMSNPVASNSDGLPLNQFVLKKHGPRRYRNSGSRL
jgi:hypothetical protein